MQGAELHQPRQVARLLLVSRRRHQVQSHHVREDRDLQWPLLGARRRCVHSHCEPLIAVGTRWQANKAPCCCVCDDSQASAASCATASGRRTSAQTTTATTTSRRSRAARSRVRSTRKSNRRTRTKAMRWRPRKRPIDKSL